MAITRYLAMTAAEIGNNAPLSPNIGWMACHFSPYGTGLSNCPRELPEGSLLILNDRTPIHGHDTKYIEEQLRECVDTLGCRGLLLDFQRPGAEETTVLVDALVRSLPCPVAVSERYAEGIDCPVFLPPVPLHMPLKDYFTPWQSREIWLELAQDGEIITLTPKGSVFTPLPSGERSEGGHRDEKLHCHYHICTGEDQVRFSLFRTAEDLDTLLEEAEEFGVTTAVGLYQELYHAST